MGLLLTVSYLTAAREALEKNFALKELDLSSNEVLRG